MKVFGKGISVLAFIIYIMCVTPVAVFAAGSEGEETGGEKSAGLVLNETGSTYAGRDQIDRLNDAHNSRSSLNFPDALRGVDIPISNPASLDIYRVSDDATVSLFGTTKNITMTVGQTLSVYNTTSPYSVCSYSPTSVDSVSYIWGSSNRSVAEVDSTNSSSSTIRALKPGTSTVSVKLCVSYTYYNPVYGSYPAYETGSGDRWNVTVYEELSWRLDNGVLTIRGSGEIPDYDVLDETSPEYPPWFEYRNLIQKIVIEDGATAIGDCAFFDCENLTSVELAGSVTRIGSAAFAYCTSLPEITLSSNIKNIGALAFAYCGSLKVMKLPANLTAVSYGLFAYCDGMQYVIMPATIKTIGDYAFHECTSLKAVHYAGSYSQFLAINIGGYNESLEASAGTDIVIESTGKYTVTFDSQGGGDVASQNVYVGSTVQQPADPEQYGYTFGGWYTDSACTVRYDFSLPIAGGLTLYARWVPLPVCVVTFVDGVNTVSSETYYEDETITWRTAEREGYDFTGWFTDPGCTIPYEVAPLTAGNLTLYAGWHPLSRCKVTFVEGDGKENVIRSYLGRTLAEPDNPTRPGYYFGGWYANRACTDAYTFGGELTGDLVLYAKWTQLHQVTFLEPTGYDNSVQMVPDGELAAEPQVPSHAGNFLGWYTNSGEQWDFSSGRVVEDTVLNARWTHTVTFYTRVEVPGGISSEFTASQVQVLYGGIVEKPDDPIYNYCIFTGWYTDYTGEYPLHKIYHPYNFSAPVTSDLELYSGNEYAETKSGSWSGYNGNGSWTLENGVLAITGSGAIPFYGSMYNGLNYTWNVGPWCNLNAREIVIGEGITHVNKTEQRCQSSQDCFYGIFGIEKIMLPSTFQGWYMTGLLNLKCLRDIYYAGTEEQWKKISIKLPETCIVHCNATGTETMHEVFFDAASPSSTFEKIRQLVPEGHPAVCPPAPEKNKCRFAGWYLGDELYDFTRPVTEGLTLTARWELEEFTVTFQTGSGNRTRTVPKGECAGELLELSTPNQTFEGWYWNGEQYDGTAPVYENIVLTPRWSCAVTLVDRGQETVQTVMINSLADRPEDPEREDGWQFNGWYTDEACTQLYLFGTPVTQAFTLYAGWNLKDMPAASVEVISVPGELSSATIYDPDGNVTGNALIYAARYENNRMTGIASVKEIASDGKIIFDRYLEGEWTIFILDPVTYIPLCEKRTLFKPASL